MRSLSIRLARIRADPVTARAVPFAVFIASVILASKLESQMIVATRGILIALLLVWFWRTYSELRAPLSTAPAQWSTAFVAGLVVLLLWIHFDQDWAVLGRSAGFRPVLEDGSINWPIALLRLASFSLVVPVMEELFWRSLVLRWIEKHDFLSVDPRTIGWRAFSITTVLFAVEHERWFAGAIAGAAYNLLYMRTGNLWVPVAAHAVTNGALGIWILYSGRWEFW